MEIGNPRSLFAFGGAMVRGVLILMFSASTALSQPYPNRPVKIVVGYAAGGSPDAVSRIMADHFTQVFRQSFIVDNKVGASGSLATTFVSQSPPDGYTLLLAETGQLEIAPQMIKLPYDPVDGFAHIGQLTRTPLVIVTGTKSAANLMSIQDLLAAAKAAPGKINFGTSGIGSGQHLAWEMFKDKAGINMTHVPYKGANQSIPALLTGEVEVVMGTYGSFEQHLNAGTLRALGVASNSRLAARPEIPHVAEAVKGYEDYSSETGLLAPLGLPAAIHTRLTEAAKAALDSVDVRRRLDALGLVRHWATPQSYKEAIAQNQKKYKQAIALTGVKPQ